MIRHSINKPVNEQNIHFILPPEKIKKDVNRLTREILSISRNINRPEYYIINTMLKSLWNWSVNDPEIKKEIETIKKIVNVNLKEVQEVLTLVNPFNFLWEKKLVNTEVEDEELRNKFNSEKHIKRRDLLRTINYLEQNFHLEVNKGIILNIFEIIKKVQNEINNKIPNEIYLSLIIVDCEKVKGQLMNILNDLQFRLEDLVSKKIFNELQNIIKSFDQSQTKLEMKFESAKQLVELESFLEDLRKIELPELKKRFKKGVEWIRLMIPQLKNKKKFKLHLFKQAYQRIQNSGNFLNEHGIRLAQQREEIEGKIELMKENLRGRLEETNKELNSIRLIDEEYLCKKILNDLAGLDKIVEEFKQSSKVMEEEEQILGKRGRRMKALDQFEKELGLHKKLWIMFDLWIKVKHVERSRSLLQENIKELWNKVERIRSLGKVLEKEFQREKTKNAKQLNLIQKISKNLEIFWKEAEVLKFLCNSNLEIRHWDMINSVLIDKEREMGFDLGLNANVEFTWNNLEDFELYKDFEKLKVISDGADKEAEISGQLRKMREFWESKVDLTSLLEKRYLIKSNEIYISNDSSEKGLQSKVLSDIMDTDIDKWMMKRKIEEDLLTLKKIETFSRFSLFEMESEELGRVIQKSDRFLALLINIENYLKDIHLFFSDKNFIKKMNNEITKGREIESRVRSILENGFDLGIDRVMASKENEYLLDNFEGELSKIHFILWQIVYSLQEENGRLYWLSSDELITVDTIVRGFSDTNHLPNDKNNLNLKNHKNEKDQKSSNEKKTEISNILNVITQEVDPILNILKENKNRNLLSDTMSKLFRGIKEVKFVNQEIQSIEGYNGEIITFSNPIKIRDSLGNIIKELETRIEKLIKMEVYNGLGNFSIMKKSDFVNDRLNQVILLVEMIAWTFEIESVLDGEGSSGLSDYIFQFNEFFLHYSEFSQIVERSKFDYGH
jgi:CHASE3 domain sensor protein